MKPNPTGGKYRSIILAALVFLALDLSVLVLNFYNSYQISRDSVVINLAGRQRMLSQNITKSLLEYRLETLSGQPNAQKFLDQAKNGAQLFDTTLLSLYQGGTVKAPDGRTILIQAQQDQTSQSLIKSARTIWDPLYTKMKTLTGAPEELDPVLTGMREQNLALLKLMNDLTNHLEGLAAARASHLRWVQSIGMGLAVINFILLLLHALRRLRLSDRAAERAARETREILDTVQEGLFLLSQNGQMGSESSKSLPAILGQSVAAEADFFALLGKIAPVDTVRVAEDYISLLFKPHVLQSLTADLNPLDQVKVFIREEGSGKSRSRWLRFSFAQVRENKAITHLLVTVQDITEIVQLTEALENAKRGGHTDLIKLMSQLNRNPKEISSFLNQTRHHLSEINTMLRLGGRGESLVTALSAIRPLMHRIKGDAALMDMDGLEEPAQQFEHTLHEITSTHAHLDGEMLIPLTVHLNHMFKYLESLEALIGLRESNAAPAEAEHPAPAAKSPDWSSQFRLRLNALVQRIAFDVGKSIELDYPATMLSPLPASTQLTLETVLTQIVRNAAVHGIEAPEIRVQKAKAATGTISIRLSQNDEGTPLISVRDDGAGITPSVIRARLIATGRYTEEALETMSDSQIIGTIFDSGFSMNPNPDAHSGQGVGMSVVRNEVQKMGARLQLRTTPEQFTEFNILLPEISLSPTEAVHA